MDKQSVYIVGLVTLFGFSSLGAAILYFVSDIAVIELFAHGWIWPYQILIGSAYGFLIGVLALAIINLKFMFPVREKYEKLVDDIDFNLFEVFFISFCAGYGEEILFRGALQYYIGIWPTALIFVAIHGYLNPKDWRISVYGVFMIFAMAVLGYMYQEIGLISAIAAHFMIDLVLLLWLNKNAKSKIGLENS